MTDYNKQLDWTSKAFAGDLILAADHDTELDAIATAIATKTDVVTSPVAGNLAKQGAAAVFTDSTIDTTDLEGLTSDLQDQLDNLQVDTTAPANHIKARNFAITNGEGGLTALDWSAFTYSTHADGHDIPRTIGKTGSGADTEWASMDSIPSNARVLLCMIATHADSVASGDFGISAYAHSGDLSEPPPGADSLMYKYEQEASGADITCIHSDFIFIPIGDAQTFGFAHTKLNCNITTAKLYYRGYLVD